jgi:Ni,Fe-hydrogenase I cytochrome b subunit
MTEKKDWTVKDAEGIIYRISHSEMQLRKWHNLLLWMILIALFVIIVLASLVYFSELPSNVGRSFGLC